MRILHTADLHLGQILYQYYERVDEHDHFFNQLTQWCRDYHPDALVVSGDLFDIPQPSAATKEYFNRTFVNIHKEFPRMAIVATAGNHDSASRIEADRTVWGLSGVTLIGHGPSEVLRQQEGWQERFVVETETGFIIAVPFMVNHHAEVFQELLDYVDSLNGNHRPVVMMGHLAVAGGDFSGHSDIGTLRTQPVGALGRGFDYMALGHIHRPQTIGQPTDDEMKAESEYSAGAIRYSGSALHVSCDERYPHSVSLVDIERHGGPVRLRRLRVDELRHFYTLPLSEGTPMGSAEEIYAAIDDFCNRNKSGYLRLRIDYNTPLPPDFLQTVYRRLEQTGNEVRFNPKTEWTGTPTHESGQAMPVFEVAELQQMTDPMKFIEQTIAHYPTFTLDTLREDFKLVEEEVRRMAEESASKLKKTRKQATTQTVNQQTVEES